MGLSCKPCGKYQSMWQKMLNQLEKDKLGEAAVAARKQKQVARKKAEAEKAEAAKAPAKKKK